jgi:hypothetical protein
MIITQNHPDITKFVAYDQNGSLITRIIEIDTHAMEAKQFVKFLVSGPRICRIVKIYTLKGPGIYFTRNPRKSRMINTGKRK